MNPRPENEHVIVEPMGRARPNNVCKQIYVPTVAGTLTDRQTHIFTRSRGEAAMLRRSWPAVVVAFNLDCFLRDFLSEFTSIITFQFYWRVNLRTFFVQRNYNPDSFYPEVLPFLGVVALQNPGIILFSCFSVRNGNGFSSIIRRESRQLAEG